MRGATCLVVIAAVALVGCVHAEVAVSLRRHVVDTLYKRVPGGHVLKHCVHKVRMLIAVPAC